MFSRDQYQKLAEVEVEAQLQDEWRKLAVKFGFHAMMLVQIEIDSETFRTVSVFNLAMPPFNGAEKHLVLDVLNNCFKKFPQPHIHAIGDFALSNLVKRYSHCEQGINKAWFFPLNFEGIYFVFFGFPLHDSKVKEIPTDFPNALSSVLFSITATSRFRELLTRVTVMELFVKEVGHDIASSVQATTATLRNIVHGRISGPAVQKKAKEVENEIMAAYRVAENLGIVVDPNYQVQAEGDFDLIDVINKVIDHHRSEAQEHQNSIKLNTNIRSIPLWGDEKAIEVALGHILMNAVKYSFNSSYITITINFVGNYVVIRISNKGIPLPEGEDYHKIWDFGFRGKAALESHVNGSGIGLYTVRKILIAHYGNVSAERDVNDPNTTYFYMKFPTKEHFKAQLKKALL